MGEFRFRVPSEWNLDTYHANAIHVIGLDGIPWPCRISVSEASNSEPDDAKPDNAKPDNSESGDSDPESTAVLEKTITISRNRDESGKLYLIYPMDRRGEMLICTGTLPVRETRYELLTELARGTLNRLRNQISIWEEGGLYIDNGVHAYVQLATRMLSKSILATENKMRDDAARQSIEASMDGIFDLSNSFGAQISKFRREHEQMSNFWMANSVGSGDQFEPSLASKDFDLLEINLNANNVELEEKISGGREELLGKRVIVGPWLDASIGGMDSSLINVDDFGARKEQLLIECRKQLSRIPRTTSLIHVVSRLNGIGHRHLSYPQQLSVTVDMLRLIEESQTDLPTLISFDFPWAERLAGAVGGVHPLQIADSLMRQGLPISFLGLDINLDYWPNGSMIRDPLQWIDLVDVWAQLGLPLVICLRMPTGPGAKLTPEDSHHRPVNSTSSNLTDENRITFLKTVMPMMIARPSVHGMIWQQWSDTDDSRFPNSGLVDEHGAPKAIQEVMKHIRSSIDGDA
ncbi:MAG: hypothetical protein GY748_00925 [Planctomycetaceae bacterium]|nr:hypothetical protein [Planctomycetaceae bacterium]